MKAPLTMKSILAIAVLAALSACGGGGGGEYGAAQIDSKQATIEKPEQAIPPKGMEWTCSASLYGDSIPTGAYIDYKDEPARWERHTVAEIAAKRPKWRIESRTKPGQSLYALSWEFANDTRNTRFVIIESGVIDSWTGEPVVQRLLDMVDYVHAEGRQAILTGYARQVVKEGKFHWLTQPQIDLHDAWNDGARYAAQQTGSEFADWGAVAFYGATDIIDAVHPDINYNLRLTWALIDAMDRAAPECK